MWCVERRAGGGVLWCRGEGWREMWCVEGRAGMGCGGVGWGKCGAEGRAVERCGLGFGLQVETS